MCLATVAFAYLFENKLTCKKFNKFKNILFLGVFSNIILFVSNDNCSSSLKIVSARRARFIFKF